MRCLRLIGVLLLHVAALLCAPGEAWGEGLTLQGLSIDFSVPHGNTRTVLTLDYQATPPWDTAERLAIPPNPCIGGIRTIVYTHAQHPEGPSRRFFNEDIRGRGNRCFYTRTNSPLKPYLIIAAAPNSQFENALWFGQGHLFEFPEVRGLTLYMGEEHVWLRYELRYGHKVVQGPFGGIFVGFNYQWSKSLRIGMFKEFLPLGGVKMYGVVMDTPLVGSPAGYRKDVANLTAVPLFPFSAETKKPPSVVLNYTF